MPYTTKGPHNRWNVVFGCSPSPPALRHARMIRWRRDNSITANSATRITSATNEGSGQLAMTGLVRASSAKNIIDGTAEHKSHKRSRHFAASKLRRLAARTAAHTTNRTKTGPSDAATPPNSDA